jgi:hypothetical protein
MRIALAMALAGGLLAGCAQTTAGTATTNGTTNSPTTTGAAAQPVDATAALQNQVHGDQVTAVDGEGATYDQTGHITFWRNANGAWQRIGASSYPLQPALGPVHPKVTGAKLTGMSHAVFILTGTFTMDGSINALAYTANAAGTWGAIKAEPNGDIGPSGQPVGEDGIGMANAFYAVHGQLETADCSGNLPMAECGGNQRVLKFWTWHGTDFTLNHTAGLKN